jgi:hypothetical protein
MESFASRRALLAALLAALPSAAFAQGSLLDQGKNLLNGVQNGNRSGGSTGGGSSTGAGASLPQAQIGSGLKDALKIASQRTVGQVGKTDGYWGDNAIRIPLPGPIDKVSGALKTVGAGGLVDDLHMKMNRAAEQAAPKALNIFVDAASKMSISDARLILTGPKDAATQYFKKTSTNQLTTAFHPVVDNTLSQVGAVKSFNSVKSQASSIPLAGQQIGGFNLTDFTVGKALDGLFHYLAVEEASIRSNPAARTTDLLKKVFG